MRIAIDARVDWIEGGIHQTVLGLASGLTATAPPAEHRVYLTRDRQAGWLRPAMGATDGVAGGWSSPAGRAREAVRSITGTRAGRRLVDIAGRLRGDRGVLVPEAPAWFAALGVDLVHFPTQRAFLTDVPSIYQPHDLQHRHLPELFDAAEIRRRDVTYKRFCDMAARVVVMSAWGRDDLVGELGIPAGKIVVVPPGSVLSLYPEATDDAVAATERRLGLPDRFALYPAQTWPHKNHLRLVAAVAAARRRCPDLAVVCPGRRTEHVDAVEAEARRLGVEGAVSLPGFVTPAELRVLYRQAELLVFPSLFEGGALPLVEAFDAGLPVACSAVTAMPDVAGGAARLFDPTEVDDMAAALVALWSDDGVRAGLAAASRRRAGELTWEAAARACRRIYHDVAEDRKAAGERSGG